jgi:hypothetical protein
MLQADEARQMRQRRDPASNGGPILLTPMMSSMRRCHHPQHRQPLPFDVLSKSNFRMTGVERAERYNVIEAIVT